MVVVLSFAATLLAIPLGMAAARRSAGAISRMLNFTVSSDAIPAWVILVLIAAGVAVPLITALIPILRATRITVWQAIDECAANSGRAAHPFLTKVVAVLRLRRSWTLAARNVLRTRTRLVLTVVLLAVGGAIFMMAFNVLRGWDGSLAKIVAARRYDMEVRLAEPISTAIALRLRNVPGVRSVERWGSTPTSPVQDEEIPLDHAYPDRGHGGTYLLGVPADTTHVQFPLREGRWLKGDDANAAVLTPIGVRLFPTARVGDVVALSVYGIPARWKVVGFVEEFGPAPAAYVTDVSFARVRGEDDFAQVLTIATQVDSDRVRTELLKTIEDELTRAGAKIELVMPVPTLRSILDDHMGILTGALTVMSLIMAAVSAAALSSTISIGVLQRTRELGVMKAIGATPTTIRRLIVAEGLFAGVLGWMGAVVLAVPLTLLVGGSLGTTAFGAPISVLISPKTALAWLAITVVVSVVAAIVPANRAAKLTVREALGAA
jgi:putative ABC transport system permease protein